MKKFTHSNFTYCIIFTVACTLFSMRSFAQCITFHIADSANPILNASPIPQNITGLQFLDIDGDGDMDCYLLSDNSTFKLYHNTGTVKHANYVLCDSTGFESVTLPASLMTFAFADLDGDGDNDCIISQNANLGGHSNYYYIRYLENVGTKQKPLFADSNGSSIFDNSDTHPSGGYIYFSFTDINGDGKIDFYTTEVSFAGHRSYIYLNNSTSAAAHFVLDNNSTYFDYDYRSFYDFNKDGLPDGVDNDGGGSYRYYQNIGSLDYPFFYPFYLATVRPTFNDGIAPYVITDLNSDGAPEAFNYSGHYTTVAPVAVIQKTDQKTRNHTFTKLTASQQSDTYTYNWEYNGKMVPGYHKPFIYALKKGEYILYITDTCGTGVSLPYHTTDNNLVAANATLSADDFTVADNMTSPPISVKAYPNPFTSQFVIQIPMAGKAIQSTIKITDLAGRIIFSQTTSATSVTTGKTLPRGTYLVQVWQENKLVFHTMMIKQ